MNLKCIVIYLLLFFVVCNGDRQETDEDNVVLDYKSVKKMKSDIKRGILTSMIEGLKAALRCDCDPSRTTCSCHPGDVCLTESCVKAAAPLLDAVNKSADPCEDFYEFGCGKWIASHMKDHGDRMFNKASLEQNAETKENIENELKEKDSPECVKKVLKALKVCSKFNMEKLNDIDYVHTLRLSLLTIGGCPMVGRVWIGDMYTWDEIISRAYSHLHLGSPIAMGVSANPEDTTYNIFVVAQPPKQLFEPLKISVVEKVAKILGHKDNDSLAAELNKVKELHKHLKNLAVPHEEIMHDDNEYRVVTINEMNKMFPEVNWQKFINNSFYDLMQPIDHTIINGSSKVLIIGKTYLETIIKDLQTEKISKQLLANYLGSMFIHEMVTSQASSTKMNEIRTTFPRKHRSIQTNSDRQWEKCHEFLLETVSPIFDYINGKHRKGKMIDEKVFEYSFAAMKEMVNESTWLDRETKEKVHEKLREMVAFSGYPPWTQNREELEDYFKNLPNISDSNAFENKLILEHFSEKKSVQRYNQRNDRHKWPRIPQLTGSSVNAFYYPEANIVAIAAGIQRYPFFYYDRPMYMNFGGMGLILGHEITHGLDKTGSTRDKHGNLKNWWTEKAKAEFERRAQCVVDQYSSYTYGDIINTYVDGKQTLSENIADNGGIRQAFLAYKKWVKDHGEEKSLPGFENLTPYQLFFVSFARSWCESYNPPLLLSILHSDDDHSADKFRVIGSLSNMKEFAETFNCKPGSKMNPTKKCVIW